jgi:hypothetical protein
MNLLLAQRGHSFFAAVHPRGTNAEIYSTIFSSTVFPIFKRNPYPADRFGTESTKANDADVYLQAHG